MYFKSTVESHLTVAQIGPTQQVSESTIYGWVDCDYIPPDRRRSRESRSDCNSQLDVGGG